MSEGWTEERVARLREMVADKATAQQISDSLGDISRAAVIGKCHRLGLQLATPQGESHPAALARRQGRALRDAGTTARSAPRASVREPANPAIYQLTVDEARRQAQALGLAHQIARALATRPDLALGLGLAVACEVLV